MPNTEIGSETGQERHRVPSRDASRSFPAGNSGDQWSACDSGLSCLRGVGAEGWVHPASRALMLLVKPHMQTELAVWPERVLI